MTLGLQRFEDLAALRMFCKPVEQTSNVTINKGTLREETRNITTRIWVLGKYSQEKRRAIFVSILNKAIQMEAQHETASRITRKYGFMVLQASGEIPIVCDELHDVVRGRPPLILGKPKL